MEVWVAVIIIQTLFAETVQHDVAVFKDEWVCNDMRETITEKAIGRRDTVLFSECQKMEILG